MSLPVKYPKTRQAESREGEQLLDNGPYQGSPDRLDGVVGVHYYVVNLREAHYRCGDGEGADAKDYA